MTTPGARWIRLDDAAERPYRRRAAEMIRRDIRTIVPAE